MCKPVTGDETRDMMCERQCWCKLDLAQLVAGLAEQLMSGEHLSARRVDFDQFVLPLN